YGTPLGERMLLRSRKRNFLHFDRRFSSRQRRGSRADCVHWRSKWMPVQKVPTAMTTDSIDRLPPTRAARVPRSRGIFFATRKNDPAGSPGNIRTLEGRIGPTVVFALAIAIAMVVSAKWLINTGVVNVNLGPRLVATTST